MKKELINLINTNTKELEKASQEKDIIKEFKLTKLIIKLCETYQKTIY